MSIDFLGSRMWRPWTPDHDYFEVEGFDLGNGPNQLEVVLSHSDDRPRKDEMRRVWKDRRGGRPNPILLVTTYGSDTVALCGPSGDTPPVYHDVDLEIAERIVEVALKKDDRFAAHRFLGEVLDQITDDLVGLRNQGLLSTHELRVGVPHRPDWDDAARNARDALDADGGRELVEDLGYEIDPLAGGGYVLRDGEKKTAVAVFLDDDEAFEQTQDRFSGKSAVSYALNKADNESLQYVVASSGNTLRLYTTDADAGFGSRGRTDTFVELNPDLLTDDMAGYLWLLFSAEALHDGGSLEEIMDRSEDYAADLGERLRERIYDDVIPQLSEAIARARDLDDPTKEELDQTYRMSLILLYRLLFVSYAEDEDFLPRRRNGNYREHSLKNLAKRIDRTLSDDDREFDDSATDYWDEVMQLTQYIHNGHAEWGLPEYDGTLLSSDPEMSEAGAGLAEVELTNAEFGPALGSLLIDETPDERKGPIDFRNIGVREFGVIYEGLLESELSFADEPLTVDKEGHYKPVENDEETVVVEAGEVYLHGQSGERKATGTYYTKSRFVEHLLDYSLDPALDDHLNRLDDMGDNEAAQHFFDLRVADISMGSGHFLVGAVDRIESRLSSYLTERHLPRVEQELDRLQEAAEAAFENEENAPEIERDQLLRRQVARRCIYGVDLNPLATELARLSLWVHTFVPGLPLTFLDYNLRTGDSLAGVGTFDEVAEALDVDAERLDWGYFPEAKKMLDQIRGDIEDLGKMADVDASEVRKARDTREKIESSLAQVRAALDIVAASRLDDDINPQLITMEDVDLTNQKSYAAAQDALESTDPLHFPAAFPEVFDGDNPGFDTVVGNPPWEEATLEEDEFWMRYEPGLMGKDQSIQEELKRELRDSRPDLVKEYERESTQKEQIRKILRNGPYPGMGTGDPDLYKGFAWRFLNLCSDGGKVGVVLPRSAFVAAGSEEFRRELLSNNEVRDLTFVRNTGEWVFDNVEPRYTIALFALDASYPSEDSELPLRGPYTSEKAFEEGTARPPTTFPVERALNWTDTASFPLLPDSENAGEAFAKLNQSPPLDYDTPTEWRARPYRELDATNDKKKDDGTTLMHFADSADQVPDDYWPIFKGSSFDVWKNDTGDRYAWADPDVMLDYLQESRENSYRYAGKRSAFYELPEHWVKDQSTLSCLGPRIAFRDVARQDDSRTARAALIPPETFLTNTAPFLLWPRGDEQDEAYLLGVLCSIPLDWYARRFVENHLNYHLFNNFPVPRTGDSDPLRQRVINLAGRLAAVDERYADWAESVGVEYGELDEDVKQEKIYELDAVVAHLYGLSREDVKVIFETFHENWDHEERLERVLDYYADWADRLDQQEAEATDD